MVAVGFQWVVEEEQNLEHPEELELVLLVLQPTGCNIERRQHNHLKTISIKLQALMLVAYHRRHKDQQSLQEVAGRNKQHIGQHNHHQMDLPRLVLMV